MGTGKFGVERAGVGVRSVSGDPRPLSLLGVLIAPCASHTGLSSRAHDSGPLDWGHDPGEDRVSPGSCSTETLGLLMRPHLKGVKVEWTEGSEGERWAWAGAAALLLRAAGQRAGGLGSRAW